MKQKSEMKNLCSNRQLSDMRVEYAGELKKNLPFKWTVSDIGKICKIQTGKLDVNEADEGGKYPFFTCAEKIYRINTPAFDTEAVLVAGNGFFNVKYYRGKFNAYQRTYVLSNISINGKYLYYYTHYRLSDITQSNRGSTIRYIRLEDLRDYPVAIAPPDEQTLIVSEIEKQFSRLDEAVVGLKRIKANLKRYKASVLKAAVEGKLTEKWRKKNKDVESAEKLLKKILSERKKKWEEANPKKKYKEPIPPDTSNLPELPEGWVWATAEQISNFITKGTTPAASKLFEGNGEVQFLKVYNLTFDGKLNHKLKPAFVARATHEGELARSMVKSGDILINIVGPPLGQVSIVPPDLTEANINQAIARFRALDGVLKQYLVFTLMAKEIMEWALKRAKTTAGQANLTLELCRALPVPLPPFAEQKEIVNEVERSLSVSEENEKIIDINLKRAERLRQAILKKAFSGQLSVRLS